MTLERTSCRFVVVLVTVYRRWKTIASLSHRLPSPVRVISSSASVSVHRQAEFRRQETCWLVSTAISLNCSSFGWDRIRHRSHLQSVCCSVCPTCASDSRACRNSKSLELVQLSRSSSITDSMTIRLRVQKLMSCKYHACSVNVCDFNWLFAIHIIYFLLNNLMSPHKRFDETWTLNMSGPSIAICDADSEYS